MRQHFKGEATCEAKLHTPASPSIKVVQSIPLKCSGGTFLTKPALYVGCVYVRLYTYIYLSADIEIVLRVWYNSIRRQDLQMCMSVCMCMTTCMRMIICIYIIIFICILILINIIMHMIIIIHILVIICMYILMRILMCMRVIISIHISMSLFKKSAFSYFAQIHAKLAPFFV